MKKDFSLKKPIRTSVIFLTIYFAALFVFCQFYGIGRVPSVSMAPTFNVGDFLLTDNRFETIERGDIIVFLTTEGSEDGKQEHFLKRVIAVEGDTVKINFGRVFVNGCVIDESYLPAGTYTNAGATNSFEVPEGCVFVLGDNRNNSFDSRYFENPYISISDIFGKVIE